MKLGILAATAFLLYWLFLVAKREQKTVITQNTVVQQIIALGKLELVQYQFRDIVEYQKEQTSYQTLNHFLPKAKAIIIVSGEAIGCIDLTSIQAKDILIKGDTTILALPAPQLCHFKINHQKSKVYDVTNGYFVEQRTIIDEAYQAAELQMQKSALDMGIYEQTNENASKILVPFLEKITGKNIVLRFQRPKDSH